ncbi:MAG: DUF5009 domain-containing protein [Candidatus Delongbacteria bacterium]|nr:DUF5009 domain-containing protein [Candidatus Delongbacteria bacterium]
MTKTDHPRFAGLDVLRGFAILGMVLSGVIPFHVLPDWMYHAQLPPPDHRFDPTLPGITWVDLVFPFFLFALGVAIPLSMERYFRSPSPSDTDRFTFHSVIPSWIINLAKRVGLLFFFALFVQHSNPWLMSDSPDWLIWVLQWLRLACLFGILIRLPSRFTALQRLAIRSAGWIGAILFLVLTPYSDGTGFSLTRYDIIIVVLANMALFGTLIWRMTRHHPGWRIGIMGLLIAFRLSHSSPGWTDWLWNLTPYQEFYQFYFLQYLLIVIPATLIGDQLMTDMNPHDRVNDDTPYPLFPNPRWIVGLIGVLIPLVTVGLKLRHVTLTLLVVLMLLALIGWIIHTWDGTIGKRFKTLTAWGVYWLIAGLTLEPFEGGIKKDHPTLSYYFVTTGLAVFLLMGIMLLDRTRRRSGWMTLVIENGKNPLLAYSGIRCLIWPLLELTHLNPLMDTLMSSPWLGFVKGCLITLLLAWVVNLFSRKGLYWRA